MPSLKPAQKAVFDNPEFPAQNAPPSYTPQKADATNEAKNTLQIQVADVSHTDPYRLYTGQKQRIVNTKGTRRICSKIMQDLASSTPCHHGARIFPALNSCIRPFRDTTKHHLARRGRHLQNPYSYPSDVKQHSIDHVYLLRTYLHCVGMHQGIPTALARSNELLVNILYIHRKHNHRAINIRRCDILRSP